MITYYQLSISLTAGSYETCIENVTKQNRTELTQLRHSSEPTSETRSYQVGSYISAVPAPCADFVDCYALAFSGYLTVT